MFLSNYISHNVFLFSAIKLLHEIMMLINDIERFQTFLYKLFCVVVAARQNTKGGKKEHIIIYNIKTVHKEEKNKH